LVGQVSLRDSTTRDAKVTNIATDGSFAIDVSDRTAPFVLKATGTADGVSRTLFSFANGPGIANINPISNVAVANAAAVGDPAEVFDKHDAAMLNQVRSTMAGSVTNLMTKLKPLMDAYNVGSTNPVTGAFSANHDGLDALFDNVKSDISNGVVTMTNVNTTDVLFTARVNESNYQSGQFNNNQNNWPKRATRPTAPTGLTAVGGDAQVTVTWNPVDGATSYDLSYALRSNVAQREDNEDSSGDDRGRNQGQNAIIVTSVTSPFVLTGLTPATTYFIIVRASKNGTRGPAAREVSAATSGTTPVATIPATPGGVTATGGTKQVNISWPAVTRATSYNLYRSSTTGVTTANGTKMTGVTSPTVQTGLADNATFFFILTAVNSAGESAASVQVAATTLPVVIIPPVVVVPANPTGVSAMGGVNQVTVSWPAVTNAASYNIYWSTTSGFTKATGTRIAAATSPFVQTGRIASTAYFYVVTAVNTAGESGPSVQATATTNAAPLAIPSAPAGVTAVGGAKQVTVSWSAVSGATSFNLYSSTTAGVTIATGTKVAGVTSPSVRTGLADGTAFFYVVTAVNSAGESVISGQATATTSPAAPPPVINGAALYNTNCANCHNPLASSAKAGTTAAAITGGLSVTSMKNSIISSNGGVALTAAQITAIAAALTSVTPPPAALDGAALYATNCASCHNPLASSQMAGASASLITSGLGVTSMKNSIIKTNGGVALTAAQIAAIAAAL
jgi:mono/diheme cytochrome c family protein